MTAKTNARIAGCAFLLYIAAGVAPAPNARVGVLFTLVADFCALALAVTLYALTREEDQDIALFGLVCRVAEGVLGAVFIPITLASTAGPNAGLAAVVQAARSWSPVLGGTFFAVGSLAFAWLLLRGRMIPLMLAWLGVLASVLLVIGLPLQFAGALHTPVTLLMWIPMAVFEIPLGFWLIIKGVRPGLNPRTAAL